MWEQIKETESGHKSQVSHPILHHKMDPSIEYAPIAIMPSEYLSSMNTGPQAAVMDPSTEYAPPSEHAVSSMNTGPQAVVIAGKYHYCHSLSSLSQSLVT